MSRGRLGQPTMRHQVVAMMVVMVVVVMVVVARMAVVAVAVTALLHRLLVRVFQQRWRGDHHGGGKRRRRRRGPSGHASACLASWARRRGLAIAAAPHEVVVVV